LLSTYTLGGCSSIWQWLGSSRPNSLSHLTRPLARSSTVARCLIFNDSLAAHTCAPTPPFPPAANCRDLANCRDHPPRPSPRPSLRPSSRPPPRPSGREPANPRRQAVPSRQACPARRRPGSLARTSRLSVVPLSQVLRPGWDPCPACKGSGAKNGLDFDDFCMANVKLGCIPYKNRPDRSPVEGAGRGLSHVRRPSAANCRTANCRTN
jgi:hypothetical protein